MAKRFMYISIGINCLVAAYQVGVEKARADWANGSAGQVAGIAHVSSDNFAVWSQSGEAWVLLGNNWGGRDPSMDLPVPTSEIKLLAGTSIGNMALVTVSDLVYHWSGDWVLVGPFPGSPVSLEDNSWGKVKERYRD